MLKTIDVTQPMEEWPALPERLGRFGTLLLAGDVAAALLCVALIAILGDAAAAAFLGLAVTFAVGVACRRYRVSYALRPRDEWYHAASVALIGAIVGTVLAVIFGLHWWGAIAGAALWTAAAGGIGAALFHLRRGDRRFEPVSDRQRRPYQRAATAIELSFIRCFDVLLASIGLIVALPLLLAIGFAIWLDDRGAVFFRQRRAGRDDSDFTMLKFRTMRSDAGEAWVQPGDERITPRGVMLRRTSLDELPQLGNVLLGEMSLVGPRPEMREYADRFARELPLYSLRHILRPGMTGWAQIHLPRNLEPDDAPTVLAYDLFYVEHVSLYLYLLCVIKTGCEFFSHRAV